MAAGRYNITIEKGATYRRQLQYKDSAGDPIDLTDYSARMQIRQKVTDNIIHLNLTTTKDADGSGLTITAASGTIDIEISAASSSNFDFGTEGVYDLEIYSGSGDSTYVLRLLEGKVKVSKNVTR